MLKLPSRAVWSSKRTLWAATIFVTVCASVPAWAGPLLEIPIGSGGTFTHGIGRPHSQFWGSAIRANELMYGANIMPILRGRLSFVDRTFVGSNSGTLFWGLGGNITFRGCADLNGDGKCNKGDLRGILMTGSFLDAKLIERNGRDILQARIVDQLNPQLAQALHLPSTSYTGELELMLVRLRNGNWRVRDGVQGGFLKGGTVPEPSSLWLLGASFLGLAAWRLGQILRLRHN